MEAKDSKPVYMRNLGGVRGGGRAALGLAWSSVSRLPEPEVSPSASAASETVGVAGRLSTV